MKKLFCFLSVATICLQINSIHAQQWNRYDPTAGFDVNTVDILKPGWIVLGGGQQLSNDSFQIMFQSPDYGITWNENTHDGYASANNSVAFADTLNGFGVGYQGRIIKTSDGGLNWGNQVFPVARDFFKIVNVSLFSYCAVGGIIQGDSMQTILMTTNSGTNWHVVYDTVGPCLKSVCFINTQKGFAVGDSGVVLTTTNGGNTWSHLTPPVQRNFTAITFINADTGFIVGGGQTGTGGRTILQTQNGGTSWTILADTTGGILNDISFVDSLEGFIAGDSATVLKTNDGGQTWAPVLISNSLTGSETFTAVKFYGRNFGVIGGRSGQLYVYVGWTFDLFTLGPVLQNQNIANVYASINTHGYPVGVKFIYSTDSTFATSYSTNLQSVVTDTFGNFYAQLTNLLPNTWYYYFAQGDAKSGDTLRFYTGAQNGFYTLPGLVVDSTDIILRGDVHGVAPVSGLVFEYGTTPYLGNSIAALPGSITDTTDHPDSALLGHVLPYTLYYYRLRGFTGVDTLRGDIYYSGNPFRILKTLSPVYQGDTSQILVGEEQGFPGPVTLYFEFGVPNGPIYQSFPEYNFSTSDTLCQITSYLNGLPAHHLYNYQIVAETNLGIFYGNKQAFYTGGFDSLILTLPAESVTSNSAVLEGVVKNYPTNATLTFVYSTDASFTTNTNSITASPEYVTDTFEHRLTALLTGVQSNTLYYYYLKAVDANGAELDGNIAAVFIGGNEIPNWDFQNWTSPTYSIPAGWFMATNSYNRVAGHAGNYALNITGAINVFALGGPPTSEPGGAWMGGEAIANRPDSLCFYINSSFAPGDSGGVMIIMYLGDSIVAMDLDVTIPRNTNGTFQRVSIPINYQSALTPDRLVLLFGNGYLGNASTVSPNTSFTIDDFAFIPPNPVVSNGDFETWFDQAIDMPDGWTFFPFLGWDSSTQYDPIVSKVFFNPPGDYAVQVKNVYLNGVGWIPGKFSTPEIHFDSDHKPSFPVLCRHTVLNGYCKALPVAGDTIQLFVDMFYQGGLVGEGIMTVTDSINDFTPFSIPITYFTNPSAPYSVIIPDSATIEVTTASSNGGIINGATSMTIDKLRFDGFAIDTGNYLNISSIQFDENGVKIFPNPAKNSITIEMQQGAANNSVIQLFDLNGALIKEVKPAEGDTRWQMDLSEASAGFYVLSFVSGPYIYNKKIIIFR